MEKFVMSLTRLCKFAWIRCAALVLLGALSTAAVAQGREDGLPLDDVEGLLYDTFLDFCINASTSAPASCGALFEVVFPPSQTPPDPQAVLDVVQQILPNQLAVHSYSALLQRDQLTGLRNRLQEVRRGGGRGVSLLNRPLYRHQDGSAGSGSAGDDTPFADTPWGFFLSGRVQTGEMEDRGAQEGFDFDSQRLTGGVDYRVNSALVLGGSLAYGMMETDVDRRRGNVDLDSVSAWFYGNYAPWENFYANWSLGYGINDYDGERNLQIGSSVFSTKYDTDGEQYSASVSGGYDLSRGAWQYGGYLSLDYAHLIIDSYNESGGEGLGLSVNERQTRSLETTLGGRVSRAFSSGRGVFIPAVDIGLVKQWKDDQQAITASLADIPELGAFGVGTEVPDTTFIRAAVHVTGVFTGGQSGYVRYQTVAGHDELDEHVVEVGYRLEF
jgi:uncharacterized protein with beta-barrel porin domain